MGLFSENNLRARIERKIGPTKMILGVFLLIIIIGTLALMLPISVSSCNGTDFLTAAFTATSATCVTGLVVVDTFSYWTRFGQTVILLLVQCGGLGFMAVATVFSLAVNRRISLRERIIMTQAFSVDEISGVVRLAKHILFRTLIFEGVGTLLLAFRFVPQYGFGEGLYKSIFHAVSAFCNAGFDVIGKQSLMDYSNDPLVCLTVISLSVLGGLGFFVWEDIRTKKSFGVFSLHTKLVLVTTATLLAFGTLMFALFEYINPNTLSDIPFFEKLLSALFQSATVRTAGFYTFSQEGMTASSKILSMFLMFVGGSSGSTAGGIKTVTFAVLCLCAISVMRGKGEVTAFGRRIATYAIMKSVAVLVFAMFLVSVGAVLVSGTNNLDMIDCAFESISAFSTTGLSTGITSGLNVLSKAVLIALMYFGRVGLLTLSIGLLAGHKKAKISYPEGKTIIG